jgi:hypothetical protein
MALGLTHLRFAALALSVATIAFASRPASAFSFENQGASGDGSKFADPDEQVKNFGSGPGGPVVQFGAQPGVGPAFSPLHFNGPSSFQGGANSVPPDPYGARSMGNND